METPQLGVKGTTPEVAQADMKAEAPKSVKEQLLEQEKLQAAQAQRVIDIKDLREQMYEMVAGQIEEKLATPDLMKRIVELHKNGLASGLLQANEELEITITTKSPKRLDAKSFGEIAKKDRIRSLQGVAKPISDEEFTITLSLSDIAEKGQDSHRSWLSIFYETIKLQEVLLESDYRLANDYRQGNLGLDGLPKKYTDNL